MKAAIIRTAILSALLSGVSAGFAHAETLTPIRFVYDWAGADHELIPIVVGQEKGFYQQAGLDVKVIFPPDSQTTARMLALGQADVGLNATTDVVFAADQGLPVIAVGLYAQHNNWGLFTRPGVPVSLKDLKGKSIAIYTDSWSKAMMPFVLKAAGLQESDVKFIIAQDSDVPLLLAGKVDIATNTNNFLIPDVELSQNKTPGQLVGKDAGVPDVPVWAYTASTRYLQQHGDVAKKWMQATIKATEWAAAHPDDAAELLHKAYPDSGSVALSTKAWKIISPDMKGPQGYMMQNDDNWLPIAKALQATGQIKTVLPADKYYTNQLLK